MFGRSRGIAVFIIFLILLVPAAAHGLNSKQNPDRIIKGRVYINDILVGGLKVEQARDILKGHAEVFPDTRVIFRFQDRAWESTYSELGITPDVEKALSQAAGLGKTGSFLHRLKERWDVGVDGKRITVPINLEKKKASSVLMEIRKEVEQKERNAKYLYHGQVDEIVPHINGRKLEKDKALQDLLAAARRQGLIPPERIELQIPVKRIYPEITALHLKGRSMTEVLGAYRTFFNAGKVGRAKNINTSVGYLDGTVIPPGGTFSFNETVGPRTKEAGFEEALIIVGQEFIPGLGGGVCQVSSTLYNAALNAGLKITERSRHSRMINYVPIGLDAAVAYGYMDLKFENNTGNYIAICGEVYGGTLDIRILGESPNTCSIEIKPIIEDTVEPKTRIKNDAALKEGKEIIESPGKKGYVTRVERHWIEKGKILKKEILSRDFYPPEARVIIKGAQKTPVIDFPEPEGEKEPGGSVNSLIGPPGGEE